MRRNEMNKGRFLAPLIIGLSMTMVGVFPIASRAVDVPRITKEELRSMLGNPNMVIVDVRGAKQWEASRSKIRGAVWEDPENVESWADKYPKDKTLVLY
jgi:hypothetical protein